MPRADALTSLNRFAQETQFFRAGSPVTYRTAHACLDVLGALNAESGGTIAQMPLASHVAAAVQLHEEPVLRVRSAQMTPPVGESEVILPLSEGFTRRKIEGGESWMAAIAALWEQLRPAQRPHRGGSILIYGNIPRGAGQSSSTALLAAIALALIDPRQAATPLAVAHKVAAAEAAAACESTPQPPGRIPAGTIISALTCMHPPQARGQTSVLRYSAQPHRFVGPVRLPENIRIVAMDTGVRYAPSHMAGGGGGWGAHLEEFRTAAAMGFRMIETIYRDLGQHHTPLHGFLANTSPLLYRQYFRTLLPRRARAGDFIRTYGPLPEPIPVRSEQDDVRQPARFYRVRTAVDHLIAEHEHAEQFLQAMEELAGVDAPPLDEQERQRTLQRAGRLLLASHHSYRLRLELSCREADWLVDRLMDAGPDRGIYGARITGAGAGGTVAALMDRSAASTDALLEIICAYGQWTDLTLGIVEA